MVSDAAGGGGGGGGARARGARQGIVSDRWGRCAHPLSFPQDASSSLPFRATPHDALRLGLPAYKEAAAGPSHPVEAAVKAGAATAHAERLASLAAVYGAGAAARESMEKQILTR